MSTGFQASTPSGARGRSERTMAKKDSEKVEGEGAVAEPVADGPLLDLSDAAVKRMIKAAKRRGFVTHDELNAVLPSEEVTSDQIEDIYAMLSEMGISVVESEETEEGAEKAEVKEEEEEDAPEGGDLVEAPRATAVATRTSEPADRTDDPVRMYLREMGSVELLSREGEIAIAKRIEAGREAMIAGLCESPLTFQAIIIWRDELNDAKVLLREIIDLEATYAGPDGKNTPKIDMTAPGAQEALAARTAAAAAPATAPRNPPPGLGDMPIPDDAFEEDDDMENSVSLSAMETELKPKVLETFDRIADAYKKLRRLQDQNVENRLSGETLSPAQERKYKDLKKAVVADVKSLSLNQNRIDALGGAALRHQQEADRVRAEAAALGRELRRQPRGLPAQLPEFGARPEVGAAGVEARQPRLEGVRRPREGRHPQPPRRHPQPVDRDRPGDP